MTKSPRINRRRFLKGSAALAGAAAFGLPNVLTARAPNSKLNVAVIGVGGRGASNLAAVAAENVVALCDVNATALDAAADRHPGAKKFTDFRKLFDRPGDF